MNAMYTMSRLSHRLNRRAIALPSFAQCANGQHGAGKRGAPRNNRNSARTFMHRREHQSSYGLSANRPLLISIR